MRRPGRSRTVVLVSAVLTLAVVIAGTVAVRNGRRAWNQNLSDAPRVEPGGPIALSRNQFALEIKLGLRGDQSRKWEGDVEVAAGRVVNLELLRGGDGSVVDDGHFHVTSPILRATLEAPTSARVTVRTSFGTFAFIPEELGRWNPTKFLDGQVSVERQYAGARLTGSVFEDDFPAVASAPDGTLWLANVEYKRERRSVLEPPKGGQFDDLVPKNNGDRIRLRRFNGEAWLPPISVTDEELDVWRPAIAVDGRGVVWVAWAQQVKGDWEIYCRGYTPPRREGEAGTWSDVIRLSNAPGSDFHVVATTDAKGTVWLAWQGWRENNYDILVTAQRDGTSWNAPLSIAESPANDWSPAIASDQKGNVFVAWDTYDKGNYDVRLRTVSDPRSAVRTVAGSARFESRPDLACDRTGRLWIAYEEGDEQWGKDFAREGSVVKLGLKKNLGFDLYGKRTIRLKCLADDRILQPKVSLDEAFREHADLRKSLPRLAAMPDGGLWLLFRHHPAPLEETEAWVSSAVHFDGRGWSAPRRLANSANHLDNRPALAATVGGLIVLHSSDARSDEQRRKQDDLFATFLPTQGGSPPQAPELVADTPPPSAQVSTVHPNERQDIARMRDYRVEAGGKSLRLLRGEFHRHTEHSSHGDFEGLLEDSWRYALDAGSLDWMGNGDHDNGYGHEYMWWIIQKMTDLHHNPPHFTAPQTYERSVLYPNGHRNVMMPRRGIMPLPRGNLEGTYEKGTPDTKRLYVYLKHFGGICASHTSATAMGTDWRDNDPAVEPIVEIYQGHRQNYEAPGAPRSPTRATKIGAIRKAGFIWNALARGYRFGFESSSDHTSTHISFGIALTDDISRQGLLDAFKKRHCYAATDNIVLDVSSGDHIMGDAFETTARPHLRIVAHGTAPIVRIDVIRDNVYVFSSEPKTPQVALDYTDDHAVPGESHYYYVRLRQSDDNLAWGSPLWITYRR